MLEQAWAAITGDLRIALAVVGGALLVALLEIGRAHV